MEEPHAALHRDDMRIDGINVRIDRIIETWDTKKTDAQYKSINLSLMFGPDIVKLYAKKAYNSASAIKGLDDAVALPALIALDLKFMVGCKCD